MKPISIEVRNFGSYKHYRKDLNDLGLVGVFGKTKSGKSTMMDMVPWTLFGTDSKESNADDVRSWNCDEPTTGECTVDTGTGIITVVRTRGKKNDLYWKEEGSEAEQRGKDLPETQKKIETRLGATAQLYVSGSYVHQFSTADRFFTATAKERRQAFEKIVDLSFPIKLVEKATAERKKIKAELDANEKELSGFTGQIQQLTQTTADLKKSEQSWIVKHEAELFEMDQKAVNFDAEIDAENDRIIAEMEALDKGIVDPKVFKDKEKQVKEQMKTIEAVKAQYAELQTDLASLNAENFQLDNKISKLAKGEGECEQCLNEINPAHIKQVKDEALAFKKELFEAITNIKASMAVMSEGMKQGAALGDQLVKIARDKAANDTRVTKFQDLKMKIIALKEKPNHYTAMYEELIKKDNPYSKLVVDKDTKLKQMLVTVDGLSLKKEATERSLSIVQFNMDKALEMRGVMSAQAIKRIEDNTNSYLERFFEADLRVTFTAKDADKIDADILNEGNPCPWNRLSGGERCMLKLAFCFSNMKQIEDTYSVKFELLMLDEALNGIDPSIRSACFHMLEALEGEYGTIMIIDHDEHFKNQFTNKIEVTRQGQWSEVNEA